jgi:hypothetical protein
MSDRLLLGALSLRAFRPMSFEYLQLAWSRGNTASLRAGTSTKVCLVQNAIDRKGTSVLGRHACALASPSAAN